jgi:TPR repeat protein
MRIAAPALLLALALGCAEEPPPPASEDPPTPADVERSADELEPPEEPPDPVEVSGGFAAGQHSRAMRLREEEPERAAEMLGGACDRGFAPSCLALADMLEGGEGVDPDPDRARGLLEQACFDGSTAACDRLGH